MIRSNINRDSAAIKVILKPVDWQNAPFAQLQVLPRNKKSVKDPSFSSEDEAFLEIAQEIRKVVNDSFSSLYGAAVVLLSDAGAARRTYNGLRLLDITSQCNGIIYCRSL